MVSVVSGQCFTQRCSAAVTVAARASLRHIRGIRPNRAANFRGPPFWTVKIPCKLTFILPLIAMLTKEPEMLQSDVLCEHTMQQNAIAAGALPRTLLGELTVLPQTS